MKINDVLQRDPATHPLANNGQARILDTASLQWELSTFVCEGQYADGIQRIVGSFLNNLGKTSQRGAWVSGFFGSGKSHLLKMLCHLWEDTEFSDGATARSLVPSMPEDLRYLLLELDTAGKRGAGLIAAAGSLLGGTQENVRLTILGVLLRAVGLPEQYPQARFCLWLHSLGQFKKVKVAVEATGKSFDKELNNLYVSAPIARAIMEANPAFAANEADARQVLKAQFPPQPTDITTDAFIRIVKETLGFRRKNERLPCALLILDEVQQYIGDSQPCASLVTEVVEALSKQMDSSVMVVAAGQSALTETQLLNYLLDRFTIRVPLSDAEVETVTRKVLLQKKASAVADVGSLLDKHAGEISRQLQGTGIGERVEDRGIIVDDYPLLPVRRRFWENCFRAIDITGTRSQLRSQLGIIHDAVAKISNLPLGALVPADELYNQFAPGMLQSGVLLREISERIIQIGRTDGPLAQRVCGLAFLIGKLPREAGADTGVRSTKDHIADLLVDDLSADNGKLRADVENTLAKLAADGALMVVGDEYRLQTREGSEWDREFRIAQAKLNSDEAAVGFKRDQFLYGEIDKHLRAIRLVQGAAKEPRQFVVHRNQTPPVADGTDIPIWIRDQWTGAQKDVEQAARAAGNESPIIFVLIPKQSADDLRRSIVEADAAKQTLDAKGNPTTREGQEARQSMASRHARAESDGDRLVREIVDNAKVYQGGGSEVLLTSLEDRIKAAAEASLIRLFPRFKEADSAAWETVIKRARDGADNPLQPTGHTEATEKHAVCQQVLSTIGAGRTGSEVRKTLAGSPFGWPRDAVDAALIALHRSQHITATLNGAALPLGQLDQNKIAKAEFRVEKATLSMTDRLAIRKLFQSAGIPCKAGEEGTRAGEFLVGLIALAKSAGGDPPLPAAPSVTEIEDIQRLVGNEQLVAIKNKAAEWETGIKAWTGARDLIAQRLPVWTIIERLAKHSAGLIEAKPHLEEIEAVRSGRLLLAPSDPANAIRVALATLLRAAVQKAYASQNEAFASALATLAVNNIWARLPSAEQESIKIAVGLRPPAKPELATDDDLATYLDRHPLSTVQAEIDAMTGRVGLAIERAAKFLEPKVQTVMLERATLQNATDVEAWIGRQKVALMEAVATGPVLVN